LYSKETSAIPSLIRRGAAGKMKERFEGRVQKKFSQSEESTVDLFKTNKGEEKD